MCTVRPQPQDAISDLTPLWAHANTLFSAVNQLLPGAVPMPLFGEQHRQGSPGMGGLTASSAMVKSEPGESMMGMYPPGTAPSYPATSSGASMYDYSFLDGMLSFRITA